MIDGGFHEVSGAYIPGILDEAARQGVPVFTLSTAGRTDEEALFGAARRTLPLDPLGPRMVWDALSDSVWDGLHELWSPPVVIVWPDARPVAGAKGASGIALNILRGVAESLAEAPCTSGRPTQVSACIAPATSAGGTALPKGRATAAHTPVTLWGACCLVSRAD